MKTSNLLTKCFAGIVLSLALSFAAYGISENDVAGIVYNETSGLRLIGQTAMDLTTARFNIAKIAFKRDGDGMAPPKIPTDAELQNPTVKAAWSDCTSAASSAKGQDAGNCDHCVIWPSDDGKVPTQNPKMTPKQPWPYTDIAKIKQVWGPFKNPAKVGDVPAGDNIYIFVYCGVQ